MRVNVCVVTNSELGWDCVVGVWPSEEEAVVELGEGERDIEYLEGICYHFDNHSVEVPDKGS